MSAIIRTALVMTAILGLMIGWMTAPAVAYVQTWEDGSGRAGWSWPIDDQTCYAGIIWGAFDGPGDGVTTEGWCE